MSFNFSVSWFWWWAQFIFGYYEKMFGCVCLDCDKFLFRIIELVNVQYNLLGYFISVHSGTLSLSLCAKFAIFSVFVNSLITFMNIYICYKFCREKQWRTEMRMISMCCVSKSLEDRTSLMTHHVLNLLLNFILSCCILFTMYTFFMLLLLLVCF